MKLPLWRRHQDAELDDELRSHLALATQDRIERGESPEEAAAAALREFGSPLRVRESVRDTWGWTSVEQWALDVGYAARALRAAPAFAAAAVLTLALGIGANTAMFSIVRSVVLQPLPFPEPDRLVALHETDLRAGGGSRDSLSWPNFRDWQQRSRTLEAMAGYRGANFTVSAGGPAVHVPGAVVSASLFATLGVNPTTGRSFVADDERTRADVAIVSDEFRREHLAALTQPVGHVLSVDGRPFTVIGVMPTGFVFPLESPVRHLWVTAAEDARADQPDDTPIASQRGAHVLQAVGRLRAGAGVEDARAELAGIASALGREYPEEVAHRGATATPLLEDLIGDVRRPLLLLMAAVGCVLLIACVNLANLLTARGVARQAELSLRVALGASRARVVRLLLAEALVLAAAGAVGALVVARWAIGALMPLAPRDVRGLETVGLDPFVFAFTGVVAAGCAVLVGLVPALRVTRGDPRQTLSTSRTSSSGPSQRRWLHGLVVAETALGVVLLVAATLTVGGFSRLTRLDPGFDVAGVATMRVSLPDSRYPAPERVAFYDRLLPELARLPGVEAVAVVGPLPLGGSRYRISLELPGDAASAAAGRPSPGFVFTSPGYFGMMRIQVLRGRDFTAADTLAAPRVAIVNESFARRYFDGVNPLGQRIRPGLSVSEPDTPWREVVGVVADVKQVSLLDAPEPTFYLPYAQGMITTPHIVMRGHDADVMPAAARTVIHAADPELALYDARSLRDRLGATMAGERFTTVLFAAFAALGLVLSAVGLYGVLAYGVSQRAHEFGVRFALGADARHLAGVVLASAFAVVGLGLLVGIAAAIAVSRVMTSQLEFVQAPGLALYASMAAVFLLIAALCGIGPARRAATADPLHSLRAT